MTPKLQQGKRATLTRDYAEFTIPNVPGEYFLFYRGVK